MHDVSHNKLPGSRFQKAGDMTFSEKMHIKCCRKNVELEDKVLLSDRIVAFAKRDNYKLEVPKLN